MDQKNRRKFPRFEGEFKVDLLNMGDDANFPLFEAVVPGKALDISKQGIRLESLYSVSVGSFISAIVYYKEQDSIALCEVMWKREALGVFCYGLYIKEWSKIEPVLLKQLDVIEKANQEQELEGTAAPISAALPA